MKKLLMVLMVVVLLCSPLAFAKEVKIQLEWQPNTEPDLAQYVVYHRVEGQGYDYAIPVKIIPAPTVTADVIFDIPEEAITINHLVVRAEDAAQDQSGDSNEVTVTIDYQTPESPVITAAVYNDTTKTIDFTWGQGNPAIVTKWKLFQSSTSGGALAQVGSDIINDGNTFTLSWNIPADGDYYFKMVAFRDGSDTLDPTNTHLTSIESLFSSDSNEAHVNVRIHPSPVKEFKIKVRIYQ